MCLPNYVAAVRTTNHTSHSCKGQVFSVCNLTTCHEAKQQGGGVAVHIINLGTKWK
jgi:hypothetical protein